ncbi:MAG: Gfo/Idh/MocA family oxidoreductase [Phycisphaeraceae bacterium]
MTDHDRIRIGFIGAGGIARQRHLPNLRDMPGVEFTAVSNRSEASSRQAADEWAIPAIETDWRRLVERDDVDAVFIGTWPATHRAMSIAALEAGKHVFCQARLACDLAEAQAMADAAGRHRDLVAMTCPPPHRMPWEPWIRRQLEAGILGELRNVQLQSISGANLGPITFRERVELSGKQILQVGIWAETLIAWLGEYETLAAVTATPIRTKRDDAGQPYTIAIPQIVHVHGRLANGAAITELHTGVSLHGHTNHVLLEGSEATLRVDAMQRVLLGKPGEELAEVDVPTELQRDWQVEQDFIDAVRAARRGASWQVDPDFHEALRYMRKVEAIHRSDETGQRVRLAQVI